MFFIYKQSSPNVFLYFIPTVKRDTYIEPKITLSEGYLYNITKNKIKLSSIVNFCKHPGGGMSRRSGRYGNSCCVNSEVQCD